ncbi:MULTISPECIES: transcription elongation factor GreB [unclassified Gilliamella]|uniref:transcription elongation factor GreB n=1 Tax=unclassified Gilliamella TaxID=2685620 RepID=UPI00080DCED4|nr:transcription elongation factor GreB [Gilliamella apicola]OCG24517.1 transcription elongation factor GreB [Gilliamella apicola]OCG27519.1 transcription elongation factor GreB [Gilliamella apicola]OCG59644.1 transcription elongation factor GreB [Gilliamella apicola]
MRIANYITREGYLALEHELKYLWKEERPKVTQAVSDAAALGDRSENAEYIYGKRRLREIDRRVRFLTKRLESLTIVDPNPKQEGRVFFGAWVKLEDEKENLHIYRIVGTDEFDPKKNWISINSPVARALIGHKIDDEISVITPNGKTYYYVVDISYRDFV